MATPHTFEFPPDTDAAIARLAAQTGRTGAQVAARVLQDALNVYEWVLTQQAHGAHLVVCDDADIDVLTRYRPERRARKVLASMLADDQDEPS